MEVFLVSGIGLSLFIEFLLLSKKPKSVADRILTIWMLIVAAQLVFYYLYSSGGIYELPFLLGIDRPLPMLHGVMLFLYVGYLTGQPPTTRWKFALHFAPSVLMLLYLTSFYSLPAEQKIAVYRNHGAGYEGFNLIRQAVMVISSVGYVAWSLVLLKKHRVKIADTFSNLQRVNLRWLQFLTFGLGAIWLLFIAFRDDAVVFPGIVLFVIAIGFLGVRQADIFSPTTEVVIEEGPSPQEREKYQRSGLTEAASKVVHTELVRLMKEEGLYKDSELSIDSLAARLKVHPNHLSQVINQREGKNFYDFVNGYRVEEFKRLVADQQNTQFTLLALALESGFNSKTSFNRCFKKATGETPTQYIASLSAQTAPM